MENQENNNSFEDKKKNLIDRANKKYSEFLDKNNSKKDEKIDIKKPNIVDKAKSFASSMISKGLDDKKADELTKKLRVLSCHGDGTEQLPPCSERQDSKKYKNSFYCGACGCGDKQRTQLVGVTIEGTYHDYSKLDYPKVSCPLKMPGFSDYIPYEIGVSENNRKKEIENRYGVEYIKEQSSK